MRMEARIVVLVSVAWLLLKAGEGDATVVHHRRYAGDAEKESEADDLIEEVTTLNDEIDSLRGITVYWRLKERVGELDSFVHAQLRAASTILGRARGLNETAETSLPLLRTHLTSMVARLEVLGFILSRTMQRGESKSTSIGDIALSIDKPSSRDIGLTKSFSSPFSDSNIQIPGTISLSKATGELETYVFIAIRFPPALFDMDGNETVAGDVLSVSVHTTYPGREAAEVTTEDDNKIIISYERFPSATTGSLKCGFMDFKEGEFK